MAARLVRALVAEIRARGERAFLHAAAANSGAIRLYLSIGFRLRARPTFTTLRVGVSAGERSIERCIDRVRPARR